MSISILENNLSRGFIAFSLLVSLILTVSPAHAVPPINHAPCLSHGGNLLGMRYTSLPATATLLPSRFILGLHFST